MEQCYLRQASHVTYYQPHLEHSSKTISGIGTSIQSFSHYIDNLATVAADCETTLRGENRPISKYYERQNLNTAEDIERNRAFFQQAVRKSLKSFGLNESESYGVQSDVFEREN